MPWLLLGSAISAGFLSSLHCLGMCGGIHAALSQCSNQSCATPRYLNGWHHVGRLITYSLLGVSAGSLGHSIFWSHSAPQITYYLRLCTGLVMVGLGGYALFRPYAHAPGSLAKTFHQTLLFFQEKFSIKHSLWLGLSWGLIPCGMVYALLATALTIGHPLTSGAFMLAFGLGTLPVFFFAHALQQWMQYRWKKLQAFRQWAPLTLLLAGVWVFLAGLEPPAHHHHHHPSFSLRSDI